MLKPESFDFNDWRNTEQYKKMKMPVGQALLLAFSMLLVIVLSAVAAYTRKSLTSHAQPWRPRTGPEAVQRQDSGIGIGRSRSGPGAGLPPLI